MDYKNGKHVTINWNTSNKLKTKFEHSNSNVYTPLTSQVEALATPHESINSFRVSLSTFGQKYQVDLVPPHTLTCLHYQPSLDNQTGSSLSLCPWTMWTRVAKHGDIARAAALTLLVLPVLFGAMPKANQTVTLRREPSTLPSPNSS